MHMYMYVYVYVQPDISVLDMEGHGGQLKGRQMNMEPTAVWRQQTVAGG